MLKEYILQNWATVLIILAFAILLKTTIFLEKKIIRRLYVLIIMIFILSIIVFFEFYFNTHNEFKEVRNVLISIRYSSTPFIIAMITYALVKKSRWYVFIPAIILAIIDIISIFTGIVYSLADDGGLIRGPLGYLPYIAVGGYSFIFVYILIKQSNKQATEIIPILFLTFAFVSGMIFPFILGKDYSQIFCVTIVIALFVYYVFSILQLTNKDALTGLLNRQAYYAISKTSQKEITGIISIDMNGLKKINDTMGHAAGDEALISISNSLKQSVKIKQLIYRLGGDEFAIVCKKSTKEEIIGIINKIEKNVSETKYSCSIGYSYYDDGNKSFEQMEKESDLMMYENKAKHYESLKNEAK